MTTNITQFKYVLFSTSNLTKYCAICYSFWKKTDWLINSH